MKSVKVDFTWRSSLRIFLITFCNLRLELSSGLKAEGCWLKFWKDKKLFVIIQIRQFDLSIKLIESTNIPLTQRFILQTSDTKKSLISDSLIVRFEIQTLNRNLWTRQTKEFYKCQKFSAETTARVFKRISLRESWREYLGESILESILKLYANRCILLWILNFDFDTAVDLNREQERHTSG